MATDIIQNSRLWNGRPRWVTSRWVYIWCLVINQSFDWIVFQLQMFLIRHQKYEPHGGAKEKVRRSPRSLRFIVQEWMSSQKTTNPSRRCGDISLTKNKNVNLTMALEEMSPSQRASSLGTMNVNARFSGNSSQSWQNNIMDQPNVKLRLWVNLNSPHFCKKNRNHLPLFLPPCSRIIFIHSPQKNFPLSNTHCKLSLAATEVSASQGKKNIYLSIHINRCNVNCGRLFFRV